MLKQLKKKIMVVCFDSQPSFSSYGTNKGIICFSQFELTSEI